jgi:beta-mannosidase
MSYAYNLWRREFRGEGRENCAGVLVWQLNDIWPGTSWALVDVDLHRKPSFYITKRALARGVVGMEREVTAVPSYITTSYQPEKAALEMWVVNGTVEAMDVLLTLSAWDIQTGEEVRLVTETEATAKRVSLAPNQTNEFGKIKIPQPERTVVVAYVDSVATGERLARWVSWPEPLKYVVWSPTLKVSATVENYGAATDTDIITLRTTAPVKGVVIFIPHEEGADAVFEDNYIDLVPGEDVRVKATGLKGRTVQMRWMCDWELEKGFEL